MFGLQVKPYAKRVLEATLRARFSNRAPFTTAKKAQFPEPLKYNFYLFISEELSQHSTCSRPSMLSL